MSWWASGTACTLLILGAKKLTHGPQSETTDYKFGSVFLARDVEIRKYHESVCSAGCKGT